MTREVHHPKVEHADLIACLEEGGRDRTARAHGGDDDLLELRAKAAEGVEQLVEHSQVRAVAEALLCVARTAAAGEAPIDEVLARLEAAIAADGLDALRPSARLGNLARPRMLEVHAALSRLRGLAAPKTLPPRAK